MSGVFGHFFGCTRANPFGCTQSRTRTYARLGHVPQGPEVLKDASPRSAAAGAHRSGGAANVAYAGRKGSCWKVICGGLVISLFVGMAFLYIETPTSFPISTIPLRTDSWQGQLGRGAASSSTGGVAGGAAKDEKLDKADLSMLGCGGADQSTWTEDHRRLCCKEHGVGCQGSAARTTAPAPAFDCEVGSRELWQPDQQRFCCESKGLCGNCTARCDHGGQSTSCGAFVIAHARAAFSGDPAACVKAYRLTLETCPSCSGCPLADVDCKAGASRPVDTAPHQDSAGCDEKCDLDGKVGTCAEHVGRAAGTPAFLAKADKCAQAYAKVLKRCPACSSCALSSTGCGDQIAAPAAPAATSATGRGCDVSCTFAGHTATCSERVAYAVAHVYTDTAGACAVAHSVMLTHCSVCSACSLDDLGCEADSPANSMAPSSAMPAAAPSTPAPLAAPAAGDVFDCGDGAQKPQADWSLGHRAWCCQNKDIGCAPALAPPLAAAAAAAMTPEAPCEAVCEYEGKTASCSARLQYQLANGFSERSGACADALAVVRGHCPDACGACGAEEAGCANDAAAEVPDATSTGAPTTTAEATFDCQDGAAHWLTEWDRSKKTYCCKMHNVGCLPSAAASEPAKQATA